MSEKSLINQLETYISKLIKGYWLDGQGNVKSSASKDRTLKGATDAILYRVEAKVDFVVKIHTEDIPAEKEGFDILSKKPKNKNKPLEYVHHLVKPLFPLEGNAAILVLPYLSATTLHDVILNKKASEDWIINELYANYLATVRSFWRDTKVKSAPSLKEIYLKRIVDACDTLSKKYKVNIQDFRVEVNDQKFGKIGDLVSSINDKLSNMQKIIKYSCVTHGDDHAKNLLIRNDFLNIDKTAWRVIDYVKVRQQGDWIFSIGKMLHWWEVYYFLENAKRGLHPKPKTYLRINKNKNTIKITYDANNIANNLPPICQKLSDNLKVFTKRASKKVFEEETKDINERLQISLFSILFGSSVRHLDNNLFALPIMIGEGFKSLNKRLI